MKKIFNRQSEKIKRKMLRQNMPQPEILLWQKIRNRQLLGYKFRRQYSINQYIVDFYCSKIKLAIEIDGDSHFRKNSIWQDARRQFLIEQLNVSFLRFTNKEVIENIDGVLEKISERIKIFNPPLTPP